MRGKLRQFLILILIATVVFVSYKAFLDDEHKLGSGVSKGHYQTDHNRQPGQAMMFEDINALMPLTQPKEHLEKMKQHEQQMLQNVRDMIRHREEEIKFGKAKGLTKPSLWKGLRKTASDRSANAFDPDPPPPARVPSHALPKRFVHLDLKGAPPTMSYIRRLFPLFRSLGVTGLLVEYEDMFPYWGPLDDIRARNSYTADDLKDINQLAFDNELELIPLVQTFGHMEFVLKRDSFKGLREVPAFPQVICPSNNSTLPLIREMIDQIVLLHPNVRYLHIGSDEVYNIGECLLCQERMERNHWNTEDILLNHVKSVSQYVKEKHRLRAIMWDDMFRKVPLEVIRDSKIGQFTDILIWSYHDNVNASLSSEIWNKYAECFQGIWIASAFKGCSFPNTFATDVGQRLLNHFCWMDVVERYRNTVPFSGIFLTGWQRFDHFATLCELLPAGFPSLAVNLRYLQNLSWNEDDEEYVRNALGCDIRIALDLEVNGPEIHCNFPGSRVYELVLKFHTLTYNLNKQFFESNYVTGFVNDYNVLTRFSSPALVEQAMMRYTDGYRNITFFEMAMKDALNEVFDKYTVTEWLESNVRPLVRRLDDYGGKMKALLVPNTWPLRPITIGPSPSVAAPLSPSSTVVLVPSIVEREKRMEHAMEP